MYGTYILTITHIIEEYNEEDEIYNLFFFSLEQGNSSSPEADLRLSHPRPGLPPHLSGYPLYPVTGKWNTPVLTGMHFTVECNQVQQIS